jgi:hypothetical protein
MNNSDYFTIEEISNILEINTEDLKTDTTNRNMKNSSDFKRINSFLFDRTNFIVKLLRLSKEKLSKSKESTLAKGLQW